MYRKRPRSGDAAAKSAENISSNPSDDKYHLVDDCFDVVLDQRFLNVHPLGIIPKSLSLEGLQDIKSSGSVFVQLPSKSPEMGITLPPRPFIAKEGHSTLLESVSNAKVRGNSAHQPSAEAPRIHLHAYAERMQGSTFGIALDSSQKELKRLLAKEASTTTTLRKEGLQVRSDPVGILKKIPENKRLEELHRERNEVLTAWCKDLKERAGLGQMLENQFGWKCEMDIKTRDLLLSNIPAFEQTLLKIEETVREFELMDPEFKRRSSDGQEIESKRAQVGFAKREAELDLKAVGRRLGNIAWGEEENSDVLGIVETGAFVARARAR